MTEPETATATVDVAVIGAGPAGFAAAVTAGSAGARVVVLDAAGRPGGQYYRRPPVGRVRRVGDPPAHPWARFDALEQQASGLPGLDVVHDVTVWTAERGGDGAPFLLRTRPGDRDGAAGLGVVRARTVVVATGAHDRHIPFPGWDLPGVMSGGATQALIKGSLTRPGRVAVVAGTGPFLLAVAATLLEARVRVAAVVEANDPLMIPVRAWGSLPGLMLGARGKGGELASYVRLLARHRVPYLRRHRVVEAHGEGGAVDAVTVARVRPDWTPAEGGRCRRIECDTVAVGFGFSAHTDLVLQLGCEVRVGEDGGLATLVDSDQQASVSGVFAAGETTGVGGADLAFAEGVLAGAAAARSLGMHGTPSAAGAVEAAQREVVALRSFASALHQAFPVRDGWVDALPDRTLVCRCEEVTARDVRAAVADLGASDPRTVKLLTRAGMGWCQGRICGFSVDRLCGGAGSAARLAAAAKRPMAAPVRMGALAELVSHEPQRDSGADQPE